MIIAKNMSVDLGDFHLRNVDLTIEDGEVFAILGQTGSGKSILLEALAGLHDYSTGSVRYDAKLVDELPLRDRRIGFVYQDYGLFPHMKVKDNIDFGLKMHKVPSFKRNRICMEMMKKLHIFHLKERLPGTLSGGEKQRTALARALVMKPKILFMDEPFSALDPNTRRQMYDLIRQIHEELDCTIIFVTHSYNDAIELADRAGIVINGQLLDVCKSEDLFDENRHPEVCRFLGSFWDMKKMQIG